MLLIVYKAIIYRDFLNAVAIVRTFVNSARNYRIIFSICSIFILLQKDCYGVSEKEFDTETIATLPYLRDNLILISRN